jgi:GNAT superfamily N-acetyltransferase
VLVLRPGFERRGVGLALARAAFDWFDDEGIEEVTFTTQPDTRADRFYGELGDERGSLAPQGDRVLVVLGERGGRRPPRRRG